MKKMKTLKFKVAALLFTAILFGLQIGSFAQRGYGMNHGQGNGQGYFCDNIPGLTDQQKSEIEEMRVAHWKERQTIQNQINEKNARLRTLQTSDNTSLQSVNNIIDEISDLQNKHWKNRAAHLQKVRNLLTDEQKVYFDSYQRGMGKGRCPGYGNGNGRGHGKGCCRWN